jgi:cytochrome c oxidase subunit 3
MADHAAKKHPWHVPEPSHWPIVGTIGAFIAAVGGIIYMHGGVIWGFLLGIVIILVTFYGWWHDDIREAEVEMQHTAPVQTGLRVGMLLFITSEVMFFFAFFWAYYHSSLPILNVVAGPWPPEGIVVLNTWSIPFLNTLILLTSGATITWAHHAMLEGERQKALIGTAATIILGIIFLGFQAEEYISATFGLKDGIYPSTFYLATGFHGFHVFVGVCFLIVCYFRLHKGHFKPDQHVGYEAAAWYWHFVDVVWLFLFVNIYWWGSSDIGHITAGG